MAKIYIRPFVDQTLDTATVSSRTQKKCVKLLYKTCSHHALLPRALEVLVDYDRTGDALYHGGFGDVWRGEFCGRDVAVKVVRIYSQSELQRVINVSCQSRYNPAYSAPTILFQKSCKEVLMWKFLRHPNVLPLVGVMMSKTRFAMVSDWMKNGNINEFIKEHPDVDRLGLVSSPLETTLSSLQW